MNKSLNNFLCLLNFMEVYFEFYFNTFGITHTFDITYPDSSCFIEATVCSNISCRHQYLSINSYVYAGFSTCCSF